MGKTAGVGGVGAASAAGFMPSKWGRAIGLAMHGLPGPWRRGVALASRGVVESLRLNPLPQGKKAAAHRRAAACTAGYSDRTCTRLNYSHSSEYRLSAAAFKINNTIQTV